MKKVTGYILALSFLPLLSVYAQAAVENNKDQSDFVMCRNNKVVRTIRIDKIQDEESKRNQCVTTYTKAGVDKEVGRASSYNSCEKILENIKTNLESANWKCKDVGNASFTNNEND